VCPVRVVPDATSKLDAVKPLAKLVCFELFWAVCVWPMCEVRSLHAGLNAIMMGRDVQGSAGDRHSAGSSGPVTPVLAGLYRYPVKGLSAQAVDAALFEAGRPMAMDRVFALIRPGTPLDPEAPRWAKKGMFIMLMLEEVLARVRTHLDVATLRFTVADKGSEVLSVDLGDVQGRREAEAFFRALVPTLNAEPRLVRSPDGHFMDKPDNVVSLINLATVRSLEASWGYPIDPMRFRANFYIDGLEPWAEFAWIGREIAIGGATFRVDRRNGRCSATNVDPETGARDLDIPGALRAAFGHKDLGVYLIATTSGAVAKGEAITVLSGGTATDAAPAPLSASGQGRRFMCRGCYLVYDEAEGSPRSGIEPGTCFEAIQDAWRCPDCGTDKGAFKRITL
jgi:GntR family transcriptional regulator/MocR family aminotransferase